MYQVKIEYQHAIRWYKAESSTDALELFNLLSKTCHHVQVWHGDDLLTEYKE